MEAADRNPQKAPSYREVLSGRYSQPAPRPAPDQPALALWRADDTFAALREYGVHSIKDDEFAKFFEDELMSVVNPKHRLLMKLLILRHLHKLLAAPSIPGAALGDAEELVVSKAAPVIGLSILAGKMFSSCVPDSMAPEKIPMRGLAKVVSPHSGQIRVLDLSRNQLIDEDLKFVLDAFRDELPVCSQVDLSQNHISGNKGFSTVSTLGALANIASLQFIVLHGNPFASIDMKAFFQSAAYSETALLAKLIWIPQKWVTANNWFALVDKARVSDVLAAHIKYYATVGSVSVWNCSSLENPEAKITLKRDIDGDQVALFDYTKGVKQAVVKLPLAETVRFVRYGYFVVDWNKQQFSCQSYSMRQ
jgi:hypothetical protein